MLTCCPTKLIQAHNERQLVWNKVGWYLFLHSAFTTLVLHLFFMRQWQTLHCTSEMADTANSIRSGLSFAQPLPRAQRYDAYRLPVGRLTPHFLQSQGSTAKPQLSAPMRTRSPRLLQDPWTISGSTRQSAVSLTFSLFSRDVTETANTNSVTHTFAHRVSAPEKAAWPLFMTCSVFSLSKTNLKIKA